MRYRIESANCPLCGSKDQRVYLERVKELYIGMDEYFDIAQCLSCGFIFTNPRPCEADMALFYPDSAGYYQAVATGFPDSAGFKFRIFSSILANHMGYVLPRFFPFSLTWCLFHLYFVRKLIDLMHIPSFIEGGRLLDIGCSWGNYIFRMRELGWNVYGIEMNAGSVAYARNVLGLGNVVRAEVEGKDLPWEDGFFHVVNMTMVLEHLYDPVEALRRVHRVLNPGGQLMLAVPDISGFEAKLYQGNCYMIQVPQHLNHFTPRSIRCALEESGFEIERIIHHNFDRDLVASAQYAKMPRLSSLLHAKPIRKTIVRLLVSYLSVLGRTSRMTVYARKKNA